ncbi:PREDICTED: rust resistance kinase Lr10-like isoform X2 [Ipomoea nil]|uniref:rust resistance kinase Lr10-like isoform X2 n=1 Tax=Ipomoea nil TaxID=35883 RepID=UPI000901261E|nr:PREDICTED: rust resistance kinase Lr10-like isoform X2 [Ipomoea nil]
MANFFFIFFFSFRLFIIITLLFPLVVVGFDDCGESRCRKGGPKIHFPFKLIKDGDEDAEHCGYPGFELSCDNNGNTVMELPHEVQLQVDEIDYASQQIFLSDPAGCLSGKMLLYLNLSLSPFQYSSTSSSDYYSLFNCSASIDSDEAIYGWLISCVGVPGHQVYALDSSVSLDEFPSPSCVKFRETTFHYPRYPFENTLQLNWLSPFCSTCEIQGKNCGLKNHNNITLGVQCLGTPKKAGSKNPIVAGAILGFFLLAFVSFGVYQFYTTGKTQKQNQKRVEKFLEDYRAIRPTRYSFADIKKITNHFSERLGEGGYGIVYKGKLSSEIHVAVKVLNDSKGNGEEFINEVGIIGKIHHVNVVRLVGFCADGFRRALVYEYLPNESLEKYIFSTGGSKNVALGWKKIQEIALGIAKGIEYLHQGCDQQILHFDIKPHNIILDHNMNPKICDFGLAKLCSKEKSAVTMTAARGTMGYIAPEVVSRNFGKVSHKSDVYSFGMLLLEMVGGRKNFNGNKGTNDSQDSFPDWVYNHLNKGGELQIRIEEEDDEMIVKKLAIIALWCIQWQPVDRPPMKQVVQMLEKDGHDLVLPSSPFVATNVTDVPPVLAETFYIN